MTGKLIAVGIVAVALLAACGQAPEPAQEPVIDAFGATPLEVEAGSEVVFSWELADNGAVGAECALVPAAGQEQMKVDCAAGSYTHVYAGAGEAVATFTVTAEPDFEVSRSVTVTVLEPPVPLPVAVDDEISVSYDDLDSLDLLAAVLGNDEAVAGELVATGVSGNSSIVLDEETGRILVDPSGSLVLDSVLVGDEEVMSFSYSVTDASGGSATARVQLTIMGTAAVEAMSFDVTELEMLVDERRQLTLGFELHGNPTLAVDWSYDVAGIVEADVNGIVTGLAAGTVTITATSVASPDVSASLVVTLTDPFIMVVDTTLVDPPPEGLVAGEFQLMIEATGLALVDWGDGREPEEVDLSALNSHVYAEAGEYTIQVWSDEELSGFSWPSDRRATIQALVAVDSWGDFAWTTMGRAFRYASNLVRVPNDLPVTVTDTEHMFAGADAFNQDLDGWDTGNVRSMYFMFDGATSFNGDISDWDTSSVENFVRMFGHATSFNQDIGDWDVSGVWEHTGLRAMFLGASSFNQDLTGWCVPIADDYQFSEGSALTPENLPRWGTCPER